MSRLKLLPAGTVIAALALAGCKTLPPDGGMGAVQAFGGDAIGQLRAVEQ